jgi:dihydroxyacid dehydratase/phosphogluconate dehydratase
MGVERTAGSIREFAVQLGDPYDCIRDERYSKQGGLSILRGNLALGAVVKRRRQAQMLVHSARRSSSRAGG